MGGGVSTVDDVDVYSLGALDAGTRLTIDVATIGSSLDAAIAIFDSQNRLVAENDDRNLAANQLDPLLDVRLPYGDAVFYVVITAAPLGPSSGSYTIDLRRSTGSVPSPTSQTVVLNFTGGTVVIPGDATYETTAFDTGDIDPAYAGRTTIVRSTIIDTVRENFAGLDLDIRVQPGDAIPSSGVTVILFGAVNPQAFGISQGVDVANLDRCDDGIVFTESFSPSRFRRVLTAEELGRAIGNVGAHEIGHLLGLNHVANIVDLMDTTGDATTLLLDQNFQDSRLHDTIFPIGRQDGLLLLQNTIGTAP